MYKMRVYQDINELDRVKITKNHFYNDMQIRAKSTINRSADLQILTDWFSDLNL